MSDDPFSFGSSSGGGSSGPSQFERSVQESFNRPASESQTNFLVFACVAVVITFLSGPFIPVVLTGAIFGILLYAARFQKNTPARVRTALVNLLLIAVLCFVVVGAPLTWHWPVGFWGVFWDSPLSHDVLRWCIKFWDDLVPYNPTWFPFTKGLLIHEITFFEVRFYVWAILPLSLVWAGVYLFFERRRNPYDVPKSNFFTHALGSWPGYIFKIVSVPFFSIWGKWGYELSAKTQTNWKYGMAFLAVVAGLFVSIALIFNGVWHEIFKYDHALWPTYFVSAIPIFAGFVGFATGKSSQGDYVFAAIFGFEPPRIANKPLEPATGKANSFGLGNTFQGYPFDLTERNLAYHVEMVAPSGAGKTNVIKNLIADRIKKGHGVIFLDLKAEFDLTAWVYRVAKSVGRESEFRILSLANREFSVPYNPIKFGDPSEILSQLMNAFTWDNSYYRDTASMALNKVVRGLCEYRDKTGEQFHLGHIHQIFENAGVARSFSDKLAKLNCTSSARVAELAEALDRPSERKNFMGLIANLDKLLFSAAGPLMSEDVKHGSFDFKDAINEGRITYLLINSMKLKESADVLGKMILQDLMRLVGDRYADFEGGKGHKPVTLIIDEFAHFATPEFIDFMDRARGAGIGIFFAHQSRADLRSVSEEFQDRIEANSNTVLVSGLKSSDDAEYYAGMIGTRTVEKETHQSTNGFFGKRKTGDSSIREVEEYIAHPNKLKTLGQGQLLAIARLIDPHWAFVNVPEAKDIQDGTSPQAIVEGFKVIRAKYMKQEGEKYLDLTPPPKETPTKDDEKPALKKGEKLWS